ncbi:MAG TPA: peptidase C15 [Beijerinckiaceae bacterium]|jgi:pyroglutamyl-peptidase
MRLLVTGFGPFPGMPKNPSAALARQVAASGRLRRHGIETQVLVLPTTYRALDEVLAPALGSGADAVLMVGVAGRAKRVRLERRAVNRLSIFAPDAAGRHPQRLAEPGRPFALRSTATPERLAVLLRRAGVPCALSIDAGRYLCNTAYARALRSPAPAIFVHIPRRPVKGLASALAEVGLALARQSRLRRGAPPSA